MVGRRRIWCKLAVVNPRGSPPWPGIPMDILEAKFSDINFVETLEKLEKAGLIGWRFGCVFVIGRPENRMGKRGFSWSKSFF